MFMAGTADGGWSVDSAGSTGGAGGVGGAGGGDGGARQASETEGRRRFGRGRKAASGGRGAEPGDGEAESGWLNGEDSDRASAFGWPEEDSDGADAASGRRKAKSGGSKGVFGRGRRAESGAPEVASGRRTAESSGSEATSGHRMGEPSGPEAAHGRRKADSGGPEPVAGRRKAGAGRRKAEAGGPATGEFDAEGLTVAGRGAGDDDGSGRREPAYHKRRRTPRSDWQFPVLTDMGFRPEQQRLFVIIATVAGVLVAAGAFVAVVSSLGTYSPERQITASVLGPDAAVPQVFHGWNSPKLFNPVTERAKDPKALTEKEVFSQKGLAVSKKLKLKLVAKQLDVDCSTALWGERLHELTSNAGCTQVARGLYASSDGRYVGQYTLLNLKDGKSASELVESLKTLYRGGWARPLTSSKAAFPPGGYSEAGGYALGHYVGLVWLGRLDGTEPTAKDDFVSLTLALRGAEKAVYRRVVAITGPSS